MSEATVPVSRRRLTFATGVQIGGRVLGAFLGVLVAASLVRSLTRPQFGELSLALTILALAGSLGDLGITQIAVREMARQPDMRPHVAGALSVTRLVMGIVLGLAGLAIAFALMSGAQARLMAAFIIGTMPIGAVSSLAMAAQARLRPELVIASTVVQSIVWLAVVVALGAVHAALSWYGVGYFGSALVEAGVTFVLVARVTDVTFAGTWRLIVHLLGLAWPIGLAGMFVTAYYKIDGVLLFHYRGATPAAYYSAAYRVIDVLQIFPVTLGGVLLPLLASVAREPEHEARIKQVFGLAAELLMAVAIPVAVCGGVLAPKVVSLIYGTHYEASIYLLQVLLPAFIPISLGYALTSQLILHGLLRPYVVIAFGGAVINVGANLLAIPRYGAAAAAWTTLGTEAVVLSAIAVVVRQRLGLALPVGRAIRTIGAAVLTGIAVWLVRESLVLGIVVAAVLYPPLLVGSGAVSMAELRALWTRRAAASA